MPNINQIFSLRKHYGDFALIKSDIDEFISTEKQKALFNIETRIINIHKTQKELSEYFDNCIENNILLLYIDITSFSSKIKDWNNNEIKEYLDNYYDVALNIIYKYNGEVEKIIGDGIICTFGMPFFESDYGGLINAAQICAFELLNTFHNNQYEIKIAINSGKVKYYKIQEGNYIEYTMIGQPITELFRLESISKTNAINYFIHSEYDVLSQEYNFLNLDHFNIVDFKTGVLSGVTFNTARSLILKDKQITYHQQLIDGRFKR